MRHFVQFIPIATTILALTFSVVLFRRWGQRGGPHLLWFAVGALTYAAGTITESWTTLFGWNDAVFRAWYITGALMGGAPLAQGSVYLHVKRRTADRLAVALVVAIVTASVLVIASPIRGYGRSARSSIRTPSSSSWAARRCRRGTSRSRW
jgi:hypothetical protein